MTWWSGSNIIKICLRAFWRALALWTVQLFLLHIYFVLWNKYVVWFPLHSLPIYSPLFSYNSIDKYKGFPEIGLIVAMCFMFSGRYSKIRHAIPIWREGMDTVKQPVWVSFFLIFLYKQAQIYGEGYPLSPVKIFWIRSWLKFIN